MNSGDKDRLITRTKRETYNLPPALKSIKERLTRE
jgi:hypothetical protein